MSKIGNKDIARNLVGKYDIDRAAAEDFVAHLFEVINDGLQREKQVKVKGLGTFKVTSVAPRKSVDVNTGEPIIIEGRDKISFTADNSMRDQVNRPFAQFETVVVNDGVSFDEIDRKFADSMLEPDEEADNILSVEQEPEADDKTEDMPNEAHEKISYPIEEPVQAAVESAQEELEAAGAQLVIAPELLALLNHDDTPAEGSSFDSHEAEEEGQGSEKAEKPSTESMDAAPTEVTPNHGESAEGAVRLSADLLAMLNDPKPVDVALENETEKPNTEAEKLQVVDVEPPLNETDKSSAPAVGVQMADTETLEEIRSHTLELSGQVERQHRMMRIVIGVASLLLIACIAAVAYMATQLERRNNRIQHLEAEMKMETQVPIPTKQAVPAVDSVAIARAKADSVSAREKQLENERIAQQKATLLAQAEAKEKALQQQKEQMAAEAKKQEEARRLEDARRAEQQKAAEAKETAQQAAYNSDVRVRTGAYVITGIAQTVTARAGQTIASISKTYLGPGMECYVEAVNGGNRSLKVGEKVKIPALKLKSKASTKTK